MAVAMTIRRGLQSKVIGSSLRSRWLATASPVASGVAHRTQETNPENQSMDQVGLFYRLDDDSRQALFTHGGLPKSFMANLETFGETCFMIRKPALEVISFMKRADPSKPVVRYVLFGKPGCGKSVTMAHVLHYAHLNDYVILHVPWVWDWMRNKFSEVVEAWKPGSVEGEVDAEKGAAEAESESADHQSKDKLMVDLPLMAASLLKHFQRQNARVLNKLNLEVSEEYVWTSREVTAAGSKLTDLVSHGIDRVKFASAVFQALVRQLKQHANNNRCRVLVAVDGFNALFGDVTNLKRLDRTLVSPCYITLTQPILEATSNDWKNGAVIVSVDQLAGHFDTLKHYHPLYLLGRKGFEHLDPFISVQVKELTDKEVNSMLDYYEDRKWIQRKGGRHELTFVSNSNPFQLMNLCAPL